MLTSETTDGLVGSLTARAEGHVLRLAMLYALGDGDATIRPAHLRASLALWAYAARSLDRPTPQTNADSVTEQVHIALTAAPGGISRTQLRDLFARNLPASRFEATLAVLGTAGRAQPRRVTTPRRPAQDGSPPPTREPSQRHLPSRSRRRRACRNGPSTSPRSGAPASLRGGVAAARSLAQATAEGRPRTATQRRLAAVLMGVWEGRRPRVVALSSMGNRTQPGGGSAIEIDPARAGGVPR